MVDWTTEISSSGENSVLRGIDFTEVAEMEFADAIWLLLTGDKPDENESELFNTILSSTIDHGVGNPSTVAARTVQSGGNDMNTSVAAGILALGDKHGGAIENSMKMVQSDLEPAEIVKNRIESGDKIPGLGHKIYDNSDPRADKIMNKAEKLEIKGRYSEKMGQIQEEFKKQKTNLVLNVDGAIAAVMSDLGWNYKLGKGIFIISRTPGLVGHVREEMEERDFRREDGQYKGK